MPDKVKVLYDALAGEYDLGSFDEFKTKMSDQTKRKALYDAAGKDYELGTFDEFNKKMSPSGPIPAAQAPTQTLPTFQEQLPTMQGAAASQSKYNAAVARDRGEISKTLSALYNNTVASFERLAGGVLDYAAQYPSMPSNFGQVPSMERVQEFEKFSTLPIEERLEYSKGAKKSIAKAADVVRSGYTTREEEKQMAGQFNVMDGGIGLRDIQSLISSSGGMAVDMGLGSLTGGTSFVLQGYNDAVEDYDSAAESAGLPPNQTARGLYGIAGGIINGLLEKLAVDKLVGDTPVFKQIQKKAIANVLKNTAGMTGKKAIDAIETAAVAEVKQLTNSWKNFGIRSLYRAGVEGGTESAQTILEEGAKLATNLVQDNEVFNEEEIRKGFLQNVVNSGVAGGIMGPIFGSAADKAFGRNVNMQVLNDIAEARTPEQLSKINDELTATFDENNFTQEERDAIMANANRYAQIKQTLPEGTSKEAQVVAIPLIENRIKIDNEIQARKGSVEALDEALKPDEEATISALEDKRSQINDDIREAVTGEKFEYFEQDGKFFKKLGDNTPEEISKNRFDLQQIKTPEDATKKSEGPVQESSAVSDISEPQGTQKVEDQKADEANVGYRYIIGEEGDDIPVTALLNKKVRIKGQQAIIYQQGQTVEARIIGTNRIIEIGNVNKLMNELPETFGIETDEILVTETPRGFRVEGQDMVNDNETPTDAINYDKNGKVMNVVLKTTAGKRRKFRGQVAQDLAYQIQLKEILKDEEQFEAFLESEHAQELENARVQAAAQAEAAPVDATVSQQETAEPATEPTTQPTEPTARPTTEPSVTTEPAFGKIVADQPNKIPSGLNRLQRKVVKDALRVVDSIIRPVQDLTGNKPVVNLHNKATFTEAVLAAGGKQQDADSRGFYLGADGTIHLNMDNLASDTMLHEGFHPILDFLERYNPEVINNLFTQLESIEGAAPIIAQARANYDGDVTQKKEAITDFVAGVADGRIVVNPTNFDVIRKFILDMLNKLGIGRSDLQLMDVENETDLVELAEFVTEMFREGEYITRAELEAFAGMQEDLVGDRQYDSSEGQDIDGTIPEEGTGRGPQFSKSTLANARKNVKKISELVGLKISRVVFYDMTRVGKLSIKNIKTGYTPDVDGKGGPLYSYMDDSVENQAVLAFVSINQAIQSLQRQQMFPDAAHAVASQNPLTAHLGNKSTLRALFGDGVGIFQKAVKTKAQEKEIVNVLLSEIDRMSNMPEGSEAKKSLDKILPKVDLKSIKTINDFRDKILLGEGDSFGKRGSILGELLQNKQSKVTAATRDAHKILHYKYGIPTIEDIAKGNNQEELGNVELGDVVKFVRPSTEPVIYTTDPAMYEMYSKKPTPAMKEGGISIELLPEASSHESYPFVLVGENVALLEEYVGAQQLYEKYKGMKKSGTFFKLGRMKKDAEAGQVAAETPTEAKGPAFQRVAPNGKPSKLTENQYKQVRTPEFKAWFGDWENDPANASKVVDENGEPLVVYHGTNNEFDIFEPNKNRSEEAYYFAKTPEYASYVSQGSSVYPVFLSIKNPSTLESVGSNSVFRALLEKQDSVDGFTGVDASSGGEVVYVALSPNQIKSATANIGTFSTQDNRIQFSKGERLAPNGQPSKLTKTQYEQVRTPEFKNWFGDWEANPESASKALDENGEPLVLFHGTKAKFDQFEYNKMSWESRLSQQGPGFYMTDNKKAASKYGKAINVFTSVKNPLVIDNRSSNITKEQAYQLFSNGDNKWFYESYLPFYTKSEGLSKEQLIKKYVDDMSGVRGFDKEVLQNIKRSYNQDKSYDKMMSDVAGILAKDGVIEKVSDDLSVYVAFNPNQIKSATENVGTFSTQDDRIQFQKQTPTKETRKPVKVAGRTIISSKAKAKIDHLFTSAGPLGPAIRTFKEQMGGELTAEVKTAEKLTNQAMELIEKYKGVINTQDVENFLSGNKTDGMLPLDLASKLSDMRTHIDKLTDRIIDLGVIEDKETRQLYINNKGRYMLRSYELFTVKGGPITVENVVKRLKNVDQAKLDAALQFLEKQIKKDSPELTDAEIKQEAISQANFHLSDEDMKFGGMPIEGAVNTKSISRRSEYLEEAPAIRALMGEFTDPVYKYYGSIFKLANIASHRDYLNKLREEGMGKFLFKNPTGEATVQIDAKKIKGLKPIGELYTFPEIKEALTLAENEKANVYSRIAGILRKSKTVYNPATHVGNILGSMAFSIVNGHWMYIGKSFSYLKKGNRQKLDALLDVLRREGVLNNNVGTSEIKQYFNKFQDVESMLASINDTSKKYTISGTYGKTKQFITDTQRNINKIPRAMEKAYAWEDDIFKILGFVSEANLYSVAEYGKEFEDLEPQQRAEIIKHASELVKSNYPTFSRVPVFVKKLSKVYALGDFLSFPVEAVRTSYNTLSQARKEMKSKNPKIKAIGRNRLVGTLLYNGMVRGLQIYGLMALGQGLSGMVGYIFDDEEEIKERNYAKMYKAPWNKESVDIRTQFSDGKLVYVDIGARDPYKYQREVWSTFWSNLSDKQGFFKSMAKTLGKAVIPFVSPDMAATTFLNLLNNKDEFGEKIVNPENPSFKSNAMDVGGYVLKRVSPGAVNSMYKMYNMHNQGDAEGVNSEVLSQLARTYEVPLEKAFAKYVYATPGEKNTGDTGFKERLDIAEDIYRKVKNSEYISDAEKEQHYQMALEGYKNVLRDIHGYYEAAKKGGVGAEKLDAILYKAKLGNYRGNYELLSIMQGRYDYPDEAYIRR